MLATVVDGSIVTAALSLISVGIVGIVALVLRVDRKQAVTDTKVDYLADDVRSLRTDLSAHMGAEMQADVDKARLLDKALIRIHERIDKIAGWEPPAAEQR